MAELTFFKFMSQPEHLSILDDFNTFMRSLNVTQTFWLEFYPLEGGIISGSEKSADAVLFVEIAGGLGHRLQDLRPKFPDLPERLILRDLPKTIESADNTKN